MREVLVSKGSPFERLDGVVAALGEAVGKADIKGIEDEITPVAQHPSAVLELGELEPVAGVEPEIESAVGFSTIWSSHKVVEGFLQRVALRQLIGEVQHDVKGSLVLVGQSVAVLEQQPTGALEIAALIGGQQLLHVSADALHGLRAESDDMKAVDDDLRVGEEGDSHIPEAAVHVHDHVLHLVPVGKGAQVLLNRCHGSVRQNVEHAAVQGIGDNALKALTTGISLEFVEGNGLRQSLGPGDGRHPQHPLYAADGGLRVPGDVLHAAAPAQQFHDLFPRPMGKAHVPAHKVVLLRKPLPARRANVSPPPVQQPQRLPAQLQIPHLTDSVIVNPVCFSAAPLAAMRPSLQ